MGQLGLQAAGEDAQGQRRGVDGVGDACVQPVREERGVLVRLE
ncbi:hypothetical protein [Streptomyces sp. NBC_00078]|nr:hypothetical protein [Streptomyces sp. NBC_00078]MCX5418144.1 hypothetical protein [Streptomyces sp. NBC_00078]